MHVRFHSLTQATVVAICGFVLLSGGCTRVVPTAERKVEDGLPLVEKIGDESVSSEGPVQVVLRFEKGWKLNSQAPSWLALFERTSRDYSLVREFDRTALSSGKVVFPALKENGTFRLQGTFYTCPEKARSQCFVRSHDQLLYSKKGATDVLEIVVHPLGG